MIQIVAAWNNNVGEDDKHKEWAENSSRQLAEHAEPGAYVNLLHPDEVSRVNRFYGPAADKLRRVKNRYDPQNVFNAPGALIEAP